MCVHKAWNLKYDTTEMTAATNEDCIGWLLENCCLIRKKWNFDSERFKAIKSIKSIKSRFNDFLSKQ